MNTMKFKKDSWHYKLVKNFSSDRPEDIADFCSYFRAVVWASVAATGFATLAVMFFYVAAVAPLMYLAIGLQYGWFPMPVEVAIGVGIDLSLIIIGVVSIASHYIYEYQEKQRAKDYEYYDIYGRFPEKHQGFISLSWAKFKDKTCHRIEFL